MPTFGFRAVSFRMYMYIRPTSQQSIVGYLSGSISGARSAAASGTHSATVRWARAPPPSVLHCPTCPQVVNLLPK